MYPLLLLFVLFAACERQLSPVEELIQLEDELILEHLEEENIDAVRHEQGFYYKIVEEGTGVRPNSSSEVQVSYVGRFPNGVVFDEADSTNLAELSLSSVIPGWRIGIPLIREGGEIQLFLPSRHGYARRPPVGSGIPPNAVLFFDVRLHRVK